jgi:hypothetical protein
MKDHGTTSMYAGGCRCDDCRGAKNNYGRDYRARRQTLNPVTTMTPAGDWVSDGLCLGSDAWLLTSSARRQRSRFSRELVQVIATCERCPVLEDCTSWVMGHDEDPCAWHVVAGMTPKERNRIRISRGLYVRGLRGNKGAA